MSVHADDDVEKVFNRIDENGDGQISASELGKVVRALDSGVTDQDVNVMLQEMDSDRDGFVNMKEFSEFNKGDDSMEEMKVAFDMYDLNKNGLISLKELHLVLEKLGEKCSVEDCEKMIRSVDSDGDGFVNFDEFVKMMYDKKAKQN